MAGVPEWGIGKELSGYMEDIWMKDFVMERMKRYFPNAQIESIDTLNKFRKMGESKANSVKFLTLLRDGGLFDERGNFLPSSFYTINKSANSQIMIVTYLQNDKSRKTDIRNQYDGYSATMFHENGTAYLGAFESIRDSLENNLKNMLDLNCISNSLYGVNLIVSQQRTEDIGKIEKELKGMEVLGLVDYNSEKDSWLLRKPEL